jgi:hypothetical protein
MSEQKNSNKKKCCETEEFDSAPTDSSVPPTSLLTSRDVAYSDGTFHKGEFIIDVMFLFNIFYYFNYYLYF